MAQSRNNIEKKVLYTGIFFEKKEIEQYCKASLEKTILQPHMTVRFHPLPDEEHREWIGTSVNVCFFGYGCDGNNEGYLCRAEASEAGLQALLDNVAVPHVTTSVSLTGKPADTVLLSFLPSEPFTLKGRYGLCLAGGNVADR